MSRFSYVAVVMLFSSSFMVYVEPAPFDVLAIYAAALFFARRQALLSPQLWPSFLLLAIFLCSSVGPAVTGAVIDTGAYLRFQLITAYLLILFYFVTCLVFRYGPSCTAAVFNGVAFAAVVSSIVGIMAFSGVPGLPDFLLYSGRARAFFKDPNVFGPFVGMAAVWLIHRCDNCSDFKQRLALITCLSICVLGVIISFSRGAWAGASVSILTYYIMRIYRRDSSRLLWRLSALVAVPCTVAAILFSGVLNKQQMDNLFYLRLQKQAYDADRFSIQELALEESASHPLGIGSGQSELFFTRLLRLQTGATHSLFVRVVVENGLVGVISFSAFLILIMYMVARLSLGAGPSAPVAAVVLAALLGVLFQSFFIDTMHWRHFWILCGLALGLHAHEWRTPGAGPRARVRVT